MRAKSIAIVAKERIKNPLATTREIEKEVGLDHSTVARADSQLRQIATKDDRILGITDTDLVILTKGQREIERRLGDKQELEKMRTVEISQVIKESTARYSLFRGDATDKDGGLKNIQNIVIE